MSASILVGYDPRARVRAPVDFGIALARLTGAKLIVASVQAGVPALPGPPTPYGAGQIDDDLIADCTEALEQVEPELRAHGLDYECLRLGGLSAAQALQEAAQADDVALLVVGSGRRPLLGSTAQRLLHGAPCPVVAVPRDHETDALRTIAAAVRGVDADHQTLAAAHALAVRAGAQLRVITVVRVTPAMYAETQESTTIRPARTIEDVEGEYKAFAERDLARAVADLGDEVPIEVSAFIGDPADVLLELSPRFDVLVCGSRGYGPVRAVLLGGVSYRLAAEADCPVLVLPRGVSKPLEALLARSSAVAR